MSPRADEYHDEDDLSSSEDDDGFKEDMEALGRACKIAGTNPDDLKSTPSVAHDDEEANAVVLKAQDPLLGPGDALVSVSDSDDEQSDLKYLQRVQELYPISSLKPLNSLPSLSLSDDDEDDMELLRAITRRFASYEKSFDEDNVHKMAEGAYTSGLGSEVEFDNRMTYDGLDPGESCPVSQDAVTTTGLLAGDVERHPFNINERCKPEACEPSKIPDKRSNFPLSAQVLFDAIKKNRSFQKLLRSKLIQMEAKIQENRQLAERVKLLKGIQVSCIRRTGQAISLKKDPRVLLISTRKSPTSSNTKINDKKVSAMCYGPAENAHVANYRMVLERTPFSLDRKKWSNVERENLVKGIKQQFQERVLQMSLNQDSSEWSYGYANNFDTILASIKDLEITPENIRKFAIEFNWDQLASKYVVGRTGAECEARWLNCEDPLIIHSPWTCEEDKMLSNIIQEIGNRNWLKIAVSLSTDRTPFQCLARYQRSLNPSMLNSEWTEEEDAQLRLAVVNFGVSNWQSVASVLERRTGTQCSNRWKKSLCPDRKGSFTVEEDERLTVAVHLFGRKWNQIAKFVPGRTQAQCRDRYVNSLDPSLKWGGWTEEEDSRLKEAITKHGFCWSKVAADVPPRTDSQCRKRWRVLFPDQVPMLQAARKMQKSALICNFVDRESERPCLSLNDFLPLAMLDPPSDPDAVNLPQKRKSRSSNTSKKKRPQKRTKKAQTCLKKAQADKVEPCSGHGVHKPKITEPHLEDSSVEVLHDHLPLDLVVTTRNSQGDFGGLDNIDELIESNQMRNGFNELHGESHTCIAPSENPEAGTTGGHYEKISSMDSLNQTGRKSTQSASISDGTAVGSKLARNAISNKGRKKKGNHNRMVRSVQTAEDHLINNKMPKPKGLSSVQILENHSCNLENMSTIEADDNGKAMSGPVDEQTMFLDGVTEPKNINVEDDVSNDVTLASFLKKKKSKGKAMDEPVDEQAMVSNGSTETKAMSVGDNASLDVTLASLLKKKGRRQGRAARCS